MTVTAPRLTRPRKGAWIAGVCAGIARRYGWSVGWVRVGYVAFTLLPLAPGILIYGILWFVIPREDGNGAHAALPEPKEVHG